MNNILDLSNRGYDENDFPEDLDPDAKVLNLRNNKFKILPEIPDNIEILDLRDNKFLSNLTNIPENIKLLYIGGTKLLFTPEDLDNYKYIKYSDKDYILSKVNTQNTELYLSNYGLSEFDFKFPETITTFYCENNLITQITNLPINVKNLIFNFNKLTTLDLRNYKKLNFISFANNLLESIKLPKNIITLNLSNNKLTNIDISEFKHLQHISFKSNKISDIKFSNNKYLQIILDENKLQKLEINNVHYLSANFNTIEELKINFVETLSLTNNKIKNIDVNHIANLTELNLGYNQLEELDVSNCKSLKKLNVEFNNLTNIKLNTNLIDLTINNNLLKKIDLRNNLSIQFLNISKNPLEPVDKKIILDLSYLINLKLLVVRELGLNELILNDNLSELDARDNMLTEINIPDSLIHCILNNNHFRTFNPKNINTLYLNNNFISEFELSSDNNTLGMLYLNDNELKTINLKFLKKLLICELNDNNIQTFPEINAAETLKLKNNQISILPDIRDVEIYDLDLENNYIKEINPDFLPSTLTDFNCKNNLLTSCPIIDNIDTYYCNLYDNYIDTLDDDKKLQNTFTDVYITNYEEIKDQNNTKKSKKTEIKCLNPTTIFGENVDNNNIDIIIVDFNNPEKKYMVHCYNYNEFFSGVKSNRIYEWDEKTNSPILDKFVYKESYNQFYFNKKSYDYAKIYNTFVVKIVGLVSVGTDNQSFVSRMHGSKVVLRELVPIKFKDLMTCLYTNTKLNDQQLMLKDIEIQDLNVHFRNSTIQKNNLVDNMKYVEYLSNYFNIRISWNDELRKEQIGSNRNPLQYIQNFNEKIEFPELPKLENETSYYTEYVEENI